jgi:hypothetical protein
MMNDTKKTPQKSSIFPENPYSTTGSCDKNPTSQNKSEISTITVNFGKISQNDANFAARASLDPAQKTQKNQKAAASRNSCGFTLCN